ncbi:MAG: hypothetical protein ACSHXK_08290 [Oceanococcus sp.]
MDILTTVLLLVAGLINFVPVFGVFGGRRLQAAYGLDIADSNLQILLRHRAVLFGLVGGFMLYAAYCVSYRPAAYAMGFISMLSYLWLCWQVGDANRALKKIAAVDAVGLVALVAAVLLDTLH